jgi:hypothetical protein
MQIKLTLRVALEQLQRVLVKYSLDAYGAGKH